MNKFKLTAFSAAFCLAISGSAIGATLSKDDYKAGKTDISAKYKTEKVACSAMTANAKDICIEEAKGREKVAKAELEASYSPSEKNSYNVRLAKADSVYAVAKEKCDDAAGNAKDVCVKEAKAAYVTAKGNAKVAEKTTEANTTAVEKKTEARQDAASAKRDADYAVAKEKCDAMAGDTKTTCINDAKQRFDQP
ncbi:MAG: hypothetical protein ABI478_00700 [Propionivibrio sp.]